MKLTSPATYFAGGLGSNPIIERPSVVFPQPLSPTAATSSCGLIDMDTLSTARTAPVFNSYAIDNPSTFRTDFSSVVRHPTLAASTASRSPSPRMLKATTTIPITSAGKIGSHGAETK